MKLHLATIIFLRALGDKAANQVFFAWDSLLPQTKLDTFFSFHAGQFYLGFKE